MYQPCAGSGAVAVEAELAVAVAQPLHGHALGELYGLLGVCLQRRHVAVLRGLEAEPQLGLERRLGLRLELDLAAARALALRPRLVEVGLRQLEARAVEQAARELQPRVPEEADLPRADLALAWMDGEEHLSVDDRHDYGSAPQALTDLPRLGDLDFFRLQKKVILRNCGSVDPMSIEETMARGTYRGAWKALTTMTPEDVLAARVDTVSSAAVKLGVKEGMTGAEALTRLS